YALAKWSVAQRATGVKDSDLDAMVADGRILRTHILRPTWHFVVPADIRWMMSLTGPRVDARTRGRYLELGLGEVELARAKELIAAALGGGRRMTRRQIGSLLEEHGVEASIPRVSHIVMHAELDQLICSGGLDGRQHTYSLLDERVPSTPQLTRDESLAELTRRYFTSHGPSTIADFTWWSSLTVADAKRGLVLVGSDLERIDVDGLTHWLGGYLLSASEDDQRPAAALLQAFDEYIVGYRATRTVAWNPNSFLNAIVIDGVAVGQWRRVLKTSSVVVETRLEANLSPAQQDALEEEAERYGRFVGLPVTLA
ncbi:MAG: winged helix DNA-binding domain-containing protein, partial [Chloroflexota bacterium]|nr:winged helix DNA-binding domain-containing protein [Chloroflexota bacterium]